jgi:pyruvate/2-oxoglutarate dehydrogenase complex dihydrolipoamide dehydrogenase (E3) component
MNQTEGRLVLPEDQYNLDLLSHVHPPDYRNPTPASRYNLVVIGGGTAGLVAATGAAELGAKVALVEHRLLGGNSLNVGSVPSKAMLRSARAAAGIRDCADYGMKIRNGYEVDFRAVMERVRKLRARIAPEHGVDALRRKGVDVFIGTGRFIDRHTIGVNGEKLKFTRAVIATGTRPALPKIPGIEGIDLLTNENLYWLTELPKRLAVIGSGASGAEMAQTFARFGSEVTAYDITPAFMPGEDSDAAAIVRQSMEKDGVKFLLGVKDMTFSKSGSEIHVRVMEDGSERIGAYDKVLMCAGRVPNLEGLNLESVGVKYNEQGITVNDRLCTTNRQIYACGDVASQHKYGHAADAQAHMVIGNALFFAAHRVSELNIPWAIYTDPEIAHVGVCGALPARRGLETIQLSFENSHRAILDGQDEGMIKIHYDKKGFIRGATIVGSHASEMISEIVVAMNHRVKLGSLASDIHPYPTQSEIIKQCGDANRRFMLTPSISKFLKWILDLRR